jgi:transposase
VRRRRTRYDAFEHGANRGPIAAPLNEFEVILNWIKQHELDTGGRKDGLTSEERAELFKLRKQVKQLTIEREILSKAAAWFARETETVPKRSSDS